MIDRVLQTPKQKRFLIWSTTILTPDAHKWGIPFGVVGNGWFCEYISFDDLTFISLFFICLCFVSLSYRVTCKRLSKVIRNCFSFAPLCSEICSENLRHFLNQSIYTNSKLKRIAIWLLVFSGTSSCLLVFILTPHLFLEILTYLLIGLCDWFYVIQS